MTREDLEVRTNDTTKRHSATMKPILFSTPMVQAILDGRKTMTRRVIKDKIKDCERKRVIEPNRIDNQSQIYFYIEGQEPYQGARKLCRHSYYMHIKEFIKRHSKYQVGDVLWVRETWCKGVLERIFYKADCTEETGYCDSDKLVKWKPSIFMPKKYARIFLCVTNVRVERLQDIDYNDILEEGYIKNNRYSPEEWFKNPWNSTAKKGYKWEDNPYVFVYEFERIEKLKDNA